MTNSRKSC